MCASQHSTPKLQTSGGARQQHGRGSGLWAGGSGQARWRMAGWLWCRLGQQVGHVLELAGPVQPAHPLLQACATPRGAHLSQASADPRTAALQEGRTMGGMGGTHGRFSVHSGMIICCTSTAASAGCSCLPSPSSHSRHAPGGMWVTVPKLLVLAAGPSPRRAKPKSPTCGGWAGGWWGRGGWGWTIGRVCADGKLQKTQGARSPTCGGRVGRRQACAAREPQLLPPRPTDALAQPPPHSDAPRTILWANHPPPPPAVATPSTHPAHKAAWVVGRILQQHIVACRETNSHRCRAG